MREKTVDMGDYEVLADRRMPECSLRVLRLSAGRMVNLHVHQRTTQIYFVMEGNATVGTDGQRKKLGPFDTFRVPPGTAHGIETESAAIVLSISIPPLLANDQVTV